MSFTPFEVFCSCWHALFMRASLRKSAGVTPRRDFVLRLSDDLDVAVADAMSSTPILLLPRFSSTKLSRRRINSSSSSVIRGIYGVTVSSWSLTTVVVAVSSDGPSDAAASSAAASATAL